MNRETRSQPMFRADHVGSLLRPERLRAAHRDLRNGQIDPDALNAAVDQSIVEAVKMQEDAGLRAVTDGEFRRASWFVDFVHKVEGFALQPVAFNFHDEGSQATWQGPVVRGKIKRSKAIVADDLIFLKSCASQTAKVTMPTPSAMHFFGGPTGVDQKIYPAVEEFFADLATVYQQEIAALAAAGCRYLQLDEVPLALLCDPAIRNAVTARGDDPDHLAGLYIKSINDALIGRPADMFVSMHLCRGNYKGRWMGEGGYDPIAERLFNEIDVDAFLLEFDSERAGTFEPLRYLPAGKQAFLGVISTKTDQLENIDVLRRRLDDAFQYADADRLGVCPQCGFASSAGGNPITPDMQRAKLELTVKLARQTWGSA